MKLLLDANISWRLCTSLAEQFGECFHVNRIGLAIPPSDTAIWNYARDNNCVIVSHDGDFVNLLFAKGYPPKAILLKTGNIDTATTLKLLVQAREAIFEWHGKKTGLFEITLGKRGRNEKTPGNGDARLCHR